MWRRAKNIYHLSLAVLANAYFRFPGRHLTVIGVTGTDGKTTTTSLIYHILKNAGRNASLISTVAAYIGDKTYDTGFHVTNPSSIPLQRFLRKISGLVSSEREKYLVLEVTSHGIDQNRIWGIPFAVGVITNVTHEHLDYHKTYDTYLKTKSRLLRKATIAILNKDDASYETLRDLVGDKKIITYAVEKKADVNAKNFAYLSQMPGGFQQSNELAAISACQALGLSDEDIKKGLVSFVMPKGRFEKVYDKDFVVMIDFAHTPNAFEKLLPVLRKQTVGRLIHVFGSAGERDVSKRPLMGKASATYADTIILTVEDPRSEKVEEINIEIKKGIDTIQKKNQIEVFDIPDRQKAIAKAVSLARKGDTIVITGKAHETSMNYGQGEEPWDDFEAVQKAL